MLSRNEALKTLLNHPEDNYGLIKFNLNVIRSKLNLAQLSEDQLIKLKELCNELLLDIEKKKRTFREEPKLNVAIRNQS